MKDNSLLKVGSLCALILAIVKLIAPIFYIIMPAELRAEVPGNIFLPAFNANSTPLMALFWLEALVGILGIGLVPALSSIVRQKSEGWVTWASNLAIFGFGVSAVGYLLSIARLPLIAKTFVDNPAVQPALAATWKASIDLLGVWGYAAVGFWILVVSILALRNSILPGWLCIVGLVTAVLHLLVPFGAYFKIQTVLIAVVVVSFVSLPVWYLGVSLQLRKKTAL
jgi:hypothetical protein